MKKLSQNIYEILAVNKNFIHEQQSKFAKNDFRESGQTAILSVIFFSIVMMVLVVSFMKTVSAVQAAATNNELQASAMASAESGVEDAKRVLSYCAANPSNSDCATINSPAANSSTCSTSNPTTNKSAAAYDLLVNVLGNKTMSNSDIKVGVQNANTEAYSCLIVNKATSDFIGTLTSNGDSRIVPLNLVDASGNVARAWFVVVQWANNLSSSAVGSDNTTSPIAGTNLPNASTWGTAPAAMHIELSRFATGDSVEYLTSKTRAVTVRPSTADGSASSVVTPPSNLGSLSSSSLGSRAYSFESWIPQATTNTESTPLLQRDCSSASTGYYCNVAFTESWGFNSYSQSTGAGDYIRLQATYNSTHFRVTAYDASGNQLYFNGVQPTVDSTGRTADAFYRVLDRLQAGGSSSNNTTGTQWYPDFAIDSGGSVCKNMTVKGQSGSDNCSY